MRGRLLETGLWKLAQRQLLWATRSPAQFETLPFFARPHSHQIILDLHRPQNRGRNDEHQR